LVWRGREAQGLAALRSVGVVAGARAEGLKLRIRPVEQRADQRIAGVAEQSRRAATSDPKLAGGLAEEIGG